MKHDEENRFGCDQQECGLIKHFAHRDFEREYDQPADYQIDPERPQETVCPAPVIPQIF